MVKINGKSENETHKTEILPSPVWLPFMPGSIDAVLALHIHIVWASINTIKIILSKNDRKGRFTNTGIDVGVCLGLPYRLSPEVTRWSIRLLSCGDSSAFL